MTFRLEPNSDAARQASLRRYRRLATWLLVAMAALFLLTRWLGDGGFWWGLLEAGAEAAMIGGLADWFAVTALFRRPMGLPVPHTAIIPRNKDRIGEGLGHFVARNFLAPRPVLRKIDALDPANRVSGWLREPANAALVADRITAALPFLVHSIEDRQVRSFLQYALREQLDRVDLAPVLGRVLRILVQHRQHQQLFDKALAAAVELLLRHEERLTRLVGEKSSWWVPSTIDRRIARRLIDGAVEVLGELGRCDHEARKRFDETVAQLIDDLEYNDRYRERVQRIKRQLLATPEVQAYLEQVWDELRGLILADAMAPESRVREAAARALTALGRALARDRTMQARFNRRLKRLVFAVVLPWRREIGGFIAEVVRQWDARTLTSRLELVVGKDLQYIRMNGTVVGALVGCLLFAATHALG